MSPPASLDPVRDPRWERLIHLVAGELPPEEAAALRRWIEADAERRDALARLERIWQAAGPSPALEAWDAEAELRRIRAETGGTGRVIARVEPSVSRGGPNVERIGGQRSRFAVALRIAAAIAILVGGLAVWRVALRGGGEGEAPAEVATRRGQRATVRFPDGTQVLVGPASSLRYAAAVHRRPRTVDLDGEAYFTVTHDLKHPFVVRTAHGIARDLGTRFVVRAYPSDSVADVVVAEGKVSLAPAPAVDSLVLAPGDLGRVTAAGQLTAEHDVSLERYLGWTEGRLVFQGTPLRDAAVQFGRWYGVDVRFGDPSLGDEEVTASFKDESAVTAIGLVASAAGLVVERRGTEFILRRRTP